MKNILATAAAAFLLVTSTGCSGFLDEELKSSLAPDNTYTSSYGFEVGVNGLYGWARSEFNTWGEATTSQGQACPYESFQVATDIVYAGHGDGSLLCKAGSEHNRSRFIVKRIFAEEFVVVRRDPSKVQFVARLNDFYYQFQKLGNNCAPVKAI